jgi:hypothetical protein
MGMVCVGMGAVWENLTQGLPCQTLSKNELLPDTADKYLCHICEEMPLGLKKYMDVELFPCVHLWVGHGISLSTACRWLHLEGFHFISHKKGPIF